MRREPTPPRPGAGTRGPPLSFHVIVSFSVFTLDTLCSVITRQPSSTVPVSLESAPYLAALVAISCTIIDSTTASRGDSGTLGPVILMRLRSEERRVGKEGRSRW